MKMDDGDSVCCVLCQQSEETEVTGALLTKGEVTAHQNCLLFSSGIFCRHSPQFDDLFGFSVDDVMSEVKRGNKLICNKCKKKGATAGCEVGRCKKSFHYPCAVTAGARMVEDSDKGNYGLYCVRHRETRENGSSVNGIKKPQTSKNPSDATLSKKRSSGGDPAAGPVKSPSYTPSTSKRRLSFSDKLEDETPKRRCEGWNGLISEDSSDSADADMAIFAPLEFDPDESANSVPEHVTRKDTESTSADSGHQLDSNEGNEDDLFDESQSLLPPVGNSTEPLQHSKVQETYSLTVQPRMITVKGEMVQQEEELSPEPTVPQQPSASPPPSPDRSTPAPPETVCESLHPSDPKPRVDSTSFWKGCNTAGCTKAVFADFIREMEEISSRIQSDEASQEDYDCALKVMGASGKLGELMIRQQEELVRKHTELQKASVAMMEVLSALKRSEFMAHSPQI